MLIISLFNIIYTSVIETIKTCYPDNFKPQHNYVHIYYLYDYIVVLRTIIIVDLYTTMRYMYMRELYIT